jgi:16S rRNA (cytosine1407-C5)-methyltransferase
MYTFAVLYSLDRYAPFTDLHALKEASGTPLRKSVRVNSLKSSIEAFKKWAEEKKWKLEEVPWCREGFFVETHGVTPSSPAVSAPSIHSSHARSTRDDTAGRIEGRDDTVAFGRDLLHQLGHTYIQEAASMLPVALLDPQPGEIILDLCAAPGSKTTQIAGKMGGVTPSAAVPSLDTSLDKLDSTRDDTGRRCIEGQRGVIVANDTQEKRLWVLKAALHRSGVTNVIVTKKEGEWFGKHMTERFDRVLVDAPCSAQGILRKDPGAAVFSHPKKIEKFASIQRRLLEAGIHAANVGGRIVYSTCTLTPEENEMIVLEMLEKFAGRVETVNHEALGVRCQVLGKAAEDSSKVQKHLLSSLKPKTYHLKPSLRLWPQTYDTEGFFCAVLQKIAPTREAVPMETTPFLERKLSENEVQKIRLSLEEQFGTSFLAESDSLFERGNLILLTNGDVANFPLPLRDYSLGLPFALRLRSGQAAGLKDGTFRITNDLAIFRGNLATKHTKEITDRELALLLQGKDIPCEAELTGDHILLSKNVPIGLGRAGGGILRNRLDRAILHQLR